MKTGGAILSEEGRYTSLTVVSAAPDDVPGVGTSLEDEVSLLFLLVTVQCCLTDLPTLSNRSEMAERQLWDDWVDRAMGLAYPPGRIYGPADRSQLLLSLGRKAVLELVHFLLLLQGSFLH